MIPIFLLKLSEKLYTQLSLDGCFQGFFDVFRNIIPSSTLFIFILAI
jgi:hypothetical protein